MFKGSRIKEGDPGGKKKCTHSPGFLSKISEEKSPIELKRDKFRSQNLSGKMSKVRS